MKEWLTALEIAELKLENLPGTERSIRRIADKEHWESRPREGRGGGREYHIRNLPPAARTELARRIAQNTAVVPVCDRSPAELPDVTQLRATSRRVMEARAAILDIIDRQTMIIGKRDKAIMNFIQAANSGCLDERLNNLLSVANHKKNGRRTISRATVYNWFKARDKGIAALAPKYTESTYVPDWAELFLSFYQQPQKPSIAHCIREMGRVMANPPSDDAARAFLKKISPQERNKIRMGKHELRKLQLFTLRTTEDLFPSCVYSADGHTFDSEVEHPIHGQPFRPEITSVIDVYTRKIVGWSVGLAENSIDVLDALSKAMQTHGIPLIWYVDLGKGFNNKMQEDPVTGFLARYGITKTNSIARNSQARGVCERLHKTVWVDEAKQLPTYIGHDMDPEAGNKVHHLVRRQIKKTGGSRLLMQWPDFMERCERAVSEYNNRPHSALPRIIDINGNRRHMTPAECWDHYIAEHHFELETLTPAEAADIYRQYMVRRVNRGIVTLFKNQYADWSLEAYHGQDVAVGFDIHDANQVWVREIEGGRDGGQIGRLICVAKWNAHATAYFPRSFIEQAQEKRTKGRLRRLAAHVHEAEAELNPTLSIVSQNAENNLINFLDEEEKQEIYAKAEALTHEEAEPAEAAPVNNTAERPRFSDDVSFGRWLFEHPDKMTESDKAFLKDLLRSSNYRDLLTQEGVDVAALKSLAA